MLITTLSRAPNKNDGVIFDETMIKLIDYFANVRNPCKKSNLRNDFRSYCSEKTIESRLSILEKNHYLKRESDGYFTEFIIDFKELLSLAESLIDNDDLLWLNGSRDKFIGTRKMLQERATMKIDWLCYPGVSKRRVVE